jgi:integrase
VSQQGTIRVKTTKAGAKRIHVCWFVQDPATGKRQQRTQVVGSLRDAKQLRAKMVVAVDQGTYTDPVKMTVRELLVDQWLPSLRDRRPNTVSSYTTVVEKWLLPVLGGVQLRALTPAKVRTALDAIGASGGRNGASLGPRSVQYAAVVLSMALKWAQAEGLVTRNVASQVERPSAVSGERPAWTAEEARAFLGHVSGHRLYTAWLLSITRGFRRGELAGLRWSDVDLDAGRIAVRRTRIMVDGKAADSAPKTARSTRTVPLDPVLTAALRTHRARQAEERLAAGTGWTDSGALFTYEDGRALIPEYLSTTWDRLVKTSGQPRISLHGARHTAATLSLQAGVPTEVVSRWLGHASVAITQSVYQHAIPSMLEEAGAKLTAIILGPPAVAPVLPSAAFGMSAAGGHPV